MQGRERVSIVCVGFTHNLPFGSLKLGGALLSFLFSFLDMCFCCHLLSLNVEGERSQGAYLLLTQFPISSNCPGASQESLKTSLDNLGTTFTSAAVPACLCLICGFLYNLILVSVFHRSIQSSESPLTLFLV